MIAAKATKVGNTCRYDIVMIMLCYVDVMIMLCLCYGYIMLMSWSVALGWSYDYVILCWCYDYVVLCWWYDYVVLCLRCAGMLWWCCLADIDFVPDKPYYYPPVYINDYWNLQSDYMPINETTP